MMRLQELKNHLLLSRWLVRGNPEIRSIEMDTRSMQPDSLFICLQGFTVDGHDFAEQAVKQGAVALLVDRPITINVPTILVPDTKRAMAILADIFYGQPTKQLHLIGVTGTNGKTTTTHLIEKILQDAGKTTGRIGTINTKINETEYEVKNTTPESLDLQKVFHKMVAENVDSAVMEVSSHALDMGRVRGCDFDVAVFTNLTRDHLDYHQTMEAYKQAKGLLFSQLGNTYDKGRKKVAVLNRDDRASTVYEKMTAADVLGYGINEKADVQASNISLSAEGSRFTLSTPYEQTSIQMRMVGLFSIYNALAAVSACLAVGVTLESMKQSLYTIAGVPGRFEAVDENQPFTVLVDYAHTPDSLLNVLQTVKQFAKGDVTVVVGCGGDRDRTKRPLMAEISLHNSDYAIFTSDNPRSEDPEAILRDMTNGLSGQFETIVDRKEAIYRAIERADRGDVVVIAGKGHETVQVIGDRIYEFDDRKVAREAIKELKR